MPEPMPHVIVDPACPPGRAFILDPNALGIDWDPYRRRQARLIVMAKDDAEAAQRLREILALHFGEA